MNRLLLSTLGLLVLLAGCAKDRAYEEEYKAPELAKIKNTFAISEVNSLTGKSQKIDYLYVPMTLGAPMAFGDSSPFYQGDEKIVNLAWSEEGLEVIEPERDERFQDNVQNAEPVLVIPGEYKSFKCEEDVNGECTHKEIENTELEWNEKDYFEADYKEIKVRERNSLDAFGVDNSDCFSLEKTGVVNYETTPGVINVELEKTYRLNGDWSCVRSNLNDTWNIENSSFKVRFHYSLIRLDNLASKNYKPIDYPEYDSRTFGFFTNEEKVLEDDFDRERKNRVIRMSRWNPDRANNEIVYYLSPEFSKPINQLILDATYKAVGAMNRDMNTNGVPLSIKLVEQPDASNAKSAGDLRYSQIVLIEDPLSNGLLGYGPSVSNPKTGEIVKAHTNMYLGVFKSITRRIYDSAVQLTVDEKLEQSDSTNIDSTIEALSSVLTGLPSGVRKLYPLKRVVVDAPSEDTPDEDSAANDEEEVSEQDVEDAAAVSLLAQRTKKSLGVLNLNTKLLLKKYDSNKLERMSILAKRKIKERRSLKIDELSIEQIREMMKDEQLSKVEGEVLLIDKKLDELSRNNAYTTEFLSIGGTRKVVYPKLLEISGIMNSNGVLKGWDELSSSQKKSVQDIILVNTYQSTLVHELGHNLGLRHNFTGSYDKENYYSNEEAQALGFKEAPAYSSVMDYAFSEFNELRIFGKYDLAALRFAYAREVELGNGEIAKLKIPLEEKVSSMESKDALEFIKNHLGYNNININTAVLGTINAGAQSEKQKLNSMIDFAKQAGLDKVDVTLEDFESSNLFGELTTSIPDGDSKRKEYAFCTDENAGLSVGCNRHDEGSTNVEIVNHLIKRYRDAYSQRNFRNGRLRFSTYDLIEYYIWRSRDLSRIRDVIEDMELYHDFFGDDIFSACALIGDREDVCRNANDRKQAAVIAGNFLVELLKLNDKTCALAAIDDPKTIVENRKLQTIYEDIRFSIDYVTKDCFDDAVITKVKTEGLVVIGQNGKFLNSFKDTNPNYPYSSDIAVRGVWAEKSMALQYLFKRRWGPSTTDDSHMALIDIAEVKNSSKGILDHLLIGKPMDSFLPFKKENGVEFSTPYAISSNMKVRQLEDAYGFLKWIVGMPQHGEGDLIKMTMKSFSRVSTDFDSEIRNEALRLRNLPAVIKSKGLTPIDERDFENEIYFYDSEARVTFSATKDMEYAYQMISALNNIESIKKVDIQNINAVFSYRSGPALPEGTPEEDEFYLSIPEGIKEMIKNLAGNTLLGKLDVDFFNQSYNEQVGPLLYKIYSKGDAYILNLEENYEKLKSTAPAGIPTELADLFNVPNSTLADFLNGVLDKETLNYYVEQLRKMPDYKSMVIK